MFRMCKEFDSWFNSSTEYEKLKKKIFYYVIYAAAKYR